MTLKTKLTERAIRLLDCAITKLEDWRDELRWSLPREPMSEGQKRMLSCLVWWLDSNPYTYLFDNDKLPSR
jgi:hypothetical protein